MIKKIELDMAKIDDKRLVGRLVDGSYIRTSTVASMELIEDRALMVITKNSTYVVEGLSIEEYLSLIHDFVKSN